MRIASLISRYLLGFIFLVFGSNGFLHFLPMTPIPGIGGTFMGALFASHEIYVIMALQLIGGVLLLVNRFVPMALVILAPVIVNILLFHIFMAPSGLPIAILVAILWILAYLGVRSAFAGLFQSRVTPGYGSAALRS